MADEKQVALSAEACYEHVFHKVFPLRPADYCAKYPQWPGLVGLEIEMLPLWTSSLERQNPATVPLFESPGLVAMLEGLKTSMPAWRFNYQPDDPTHLLTITLDDSDMISFEPGGQLEFSTRPYPCLLEAVQRMEAIQAVLDKQAQAAGITILQTGMNPWLTVETIGLQMTKPRYRAMDAYFTALNPYGRRMMRQTCTIQVNLDFGGTEDILAKRYLLANLLAPHATSIFANSPFLDGVANGYLSNRARTWQFMDDSRTGFPDLSGVVSSMNRQSCVQAYYDLMMNGRVVFIESLDFQVMDGTLRFSDWVRDGFRGVRPTLKDLQTHLSLQFPEVRARGFMELRSLDCQSRVWQVAPSAFYTAMLYDDKAVDEGLALLLPQRHRLQEYWTKSALGLADPDMANLAKAIARLAVDGFARLPSCFQGANSSKILQTFFATFTQQGHTPADALLEAHKVQGGLTPSGLLGLEAKWLKMLESA